MTFPRTVYFGVLLLAAAWCAGIVAAPILQPSFISSFLSSVFSHVCHQFPSRSFHFAGEPFGVCVRCTGIYGGFFFSLAIYPLLARWHRTIVPSPWILGLFLLPMALDVVLHFFGFLRNVETSRLATGILCGLVLPYYLMPPLTDAARYFLSHRGDLSHARETR